MHPGKKHSGNKRLFHLNVMIPAESLQTRNSKNQTVNVLIIAFFE